MRLTLRNILLSLIYSLLPLGGLFGQTTVYTDPIGCISRTVNADADTRIGLPLLREPLFEGKIAAVNVNIINFNGDVFSENEFVYGEANNVEPSNSYYALVMTGVQLK